LKIAFVINSLNKGGAERVVSLLSTELSKKHDVFILLFDNSISYEYGGTIIDLKSASIPNKIGKIYNVVKRSYKLKKIFKKEKFDKIFAFMESSYLPSILTGFSIIASVRNNPNVYSRFITKNILSKAEKIVAVSSQIQMMLNNEFNILNTTTILNPIIIDNDYNIVEDLSKYQPYILSVGRFSKQKNFEMLINAYSKSKTQRNVKLLILGEGENREKFENLIEKLDLPNKVLLLGQKDNIKDYYLQSDIYILSSSYEGFPNVLIEALSNGCACIATNCPTGPKEIIINNENGILVENENQEAMTRAIDKLFFDENLKDKFINNAQKSIEYLKLTNIAKQWTEID
jgi:GalNAc-alpha-(1->4)-GalNAc-alpha-(1->3)-diNAcBac-PP-undecaprenol alpha-1,4-N-acetyl-D-galactosaminyltransferase